MDCKHERQARLDRWIKDSKGDACAFCLQAEVEKLKAALHDAEAIGDFSEELRSRYLLKQEIERLNASIEDIGTDRDPLWVEACRIKKERDKLKAENRELKLEAIAAETIKYHPEEDGLTREVKLCKALELWRDFYHMDDKHFTSKHGPHVSKNDLLKVTEEALKGDSPSHS